MLPLSLLKTAQNHPMLVELKNGETYNGHLVNCDAWMNINLREVICTSKDGDKFWKMPECYIRGSTIKYLRIPEEVIDMVKEENQVKNRQREYRNARGGGGSGGGGMRGNRSNRGAMDTKQDVGSGNEMGGETDGNTDEIFLGSHLDISLETLKDSMDLLLDVPDGASVREPESVAGDVKEERREVDDENGVLDEDSAEKQPETSENDTTKSNVKRSRRKSQGLKELRNLLTSMNDAKIDLVEPGQKRNRSMSSDLVDGPGDGSKRRKRESTDSQPIVATVSSNGKSKNRKDLFCWQCHKDGVLVSCQTCPRSYHSKCMGTPYSNTACPECSQISLAENSRTRSVSLQSVSVETLAQLLEITLTKIVQCDGGKSDPFLSPVDELEFPDYFDYIVNPMDISLLKKNISNNKYTSTDAFLADVKWILHNSIIFNSVHSKITSYAKHIVKLCKQELGEIKNCVQCYLRASGPNPLSTWFEEACDRPHLLLWAKLKSYPYWPAKKIFANQNYVDVRFFGAHDRAWVPVKDCYLFSEKNPNKKPLTASPTTASYTEEFDRCLQELGRHIKKLEEKFGAFNYAPFQTPYNWRNDAQQLRIMLPKYVGSELEDETEADDGKDEQKNGEINKSNVTAKQTVSSTVSVRSQRRSLRTSETAMEGYGTEEDEDDVRKNQQAGESFGLFGSGDGVGAEKQSVDTELQLPTAIKTEVLSDEETDNRPKQQLSHHFNYPIAVPIVTTVATAAAVATTTVLTAQKPMRIVNMTMGPQLISSAAAAAAATTTTAKRKLLPSGQKAIPYASSAYKPPLQSTSGATTTTLFIPCSVAPVAPMATAGTAKPTNSKHFTKPIPILINPKGMNKVSTFNIINNGTNSGSAGASSGPASAGLDHQQHQVVGSMMVTTNNSGVPLQRTTNLWSNRMRSLAPAPKMLQLTTASKGGTALANFPPNKLLVTNAQARQQPQQHLPDDKLPRFATDNYAMSASGSLQSDLPRKIQSLVDKMPAPQIPKPSPQPPTSSTTTTTSSSTVSTTPAILQNSSIAKIIELTTAKMNNYFKSLIVDISKEINEQQGGANEFLARNFEAQIDRMRRQHAEQIVQLKENALLTLNEMQKLAKMDKVIAIENLRHRHEQEKLSAIAATKTRQWCAVCRNEAQFYCCWNTSYCDYPCQKKHWDVHAKHCKQAKELLVADETDDGTKSTDDDTKSVDAAATTATAAAAETTTEPKNTTDETAN